MAKTLLERLQDWYRNNCDGDWEHNYGIRIETIDNPGWSVEIDLESTALEKATYKKQSKSGNEDWLFIEIKDALFSGIGDPNKLTEILRIFLDDVLPTQLDPEFTYPIFVPVPNAIVLVWKEVTAKMVSESIFEIIAIEETSFQNLQVLEMEDFPKFELEDLGLIEYKVGDRVTCELKTFFEGNRLVVSGKVKYAPEN